MAKIDPRLVDLLKSYGETNDAVWDCHGTWVAYHAAIERMAAKAKIVFDLPQMIVNDPVEKNVVICVSAVMADRREWSFGEVSKVNNKNAYPYAMAEKRAKDRVALKLLGMAGLVYSEEEVDDFKDSKPTTDDVREEVEHKPTKSSASLKRANSWDGLKEELAQDMVDVRSTVSLDQIRVIYRERAKSEGWTRAWLEALADEFAYYEDQIKGRERVTDVSGRTLEYAEAGE